MIKITLPYLSFRYDVDFLLTKQTILHNQIWRTSFYIHIISSVFVLFFGALQFIGSIRIKYSILHKWFGKIYIIVVLLFSAPSGLIMSFYANGGIWAKLSFVILSILWWLFTFIAYRKIKKNKIQAHIIHMTRSYALTLSAITLRTYVVVLPLFLHLHGREMYVLVAWLSWIPNLILAEILVKTKAIN